MFEQKITLNGGLLINHKIKIESKSKLMFYFKELLKEEEGITRGRFLSK